MQFSGLATFDNFNTLSNSDNFNNLANFDNQNAIIMSYSYLQQSMPDVQQTQKDYCYHHLTEEAFQPTLYFAHCQKLHFMNFYQTALSPFSASCVPGVSSNDPHEQMHNCTCCICVAFLQCVFLNVPSICLAERINSHTDYICSFLFHCV